MRQDRNQGEDGIVRGEQRDDPADDQGEEDAVRHGAMKLRLREPGPHDQRVRVGQEVHAETEHRSLGVPVVGGDGEGERDVADLHSILRQRGFKPPSFERTISREHDREVATRHGEGHLGWAPVAHAAEEMAQHRAVAHEIRDAGET